MPAELKTTQDRLLYESKRALIYRRAIDGQSVILKTLKAAYNHAESLAWFRREYEITRNLNITGAVKAYEFWDDGDRPTIILEDFGGESLTQLALAGNLSIAEFLELAIAIAGALGQVHGAGIIHKDINPSNIVLNPETKQVKIIDFGIATVRSREITTFRNAHTLEGTLAYISPEQTGRMNRAIDPRSDLYSLGVTFYELLTGHLPFQHCDPVELVHAHIAKTPIGLGNRGEIPEVFSDIVMKLMAKNAEDRYQSAYGLKADLEICWQQWTQNQQIELFELGGSDRGDRLQIPQKLYGRDREITALLDAFEGVIRHQKLSLCLVKGYSGIGKSALVAEVHKPITARHGFFIAGKFDRLHREIPYSAIASALGALMRQLLAEPETELQKWRERLQATLGNNGRVIAEIVPELELILGQQPEVSQLGAKESQNRFNLTLQNFIRTFARIEHPLVLFLDDLQWADSASLGLLHLLATASDMGYLFLIGAYRDNEVKGAHPLMLKVNKIRRSGVQISEIALQPLPLEEIQEFLADTFLCSLVLTRPLAKLLLEKTDGNPFFLNEFLKALYAEELLNFDAKQQEWQWDIEKIRRREMTANVVELLAEKIHKLPIAAQQMVQLASCIGNEFDLPTLGGISPASSLDFAIELQWAISEGILIPLDESYKLIESKILTRTTLRLKFAHDRLQQAAYSLFSDKEKQQLHLRIGRLLLQQTPPDKCEEKVFDIVKHLNLIRQGMSQRSQKDELAKLNLLAGKKAKASAARRSAFTYLQIGLELLHPSSWEQQYEFTLELHVEAVEVAYMCGEFELMEEWSEIVLQQARSVLDTIKVYESRLLSYMANSQPERAVKIALDALNLLGVKLPKKPNKLQLMSALSQINLALINKKPEDLLELPVMSKPTQLAALRILVSVSPAAYIATPQLSLLIALKQVSLSFKYGNAPLSAFAYCNYGLLLCGVLGNVETGYQFGQLGANLLVKLNAKELKAKVLMTFNTFIVHWREDLQATLNPLLEAYQSGIETGDVEFAAYSLTVYVLHLFFTARVLNQSALEIENFSKKIEQLKQKPALYKIQQVQQTVFNLIGKTENPLCLHGEAYNEQKMLALHRQEGDRTAICYLYVCKLMLCYLFASYSEAEQNSLQAEENLDFIVGTIYVGVFHFYSALTCISLCSHASKSQQKHLLKKVNAYQKKMKKWARHAPMNYLHKYHLIEAERYRILGKYEIAADLYDRAIAGAKENEYIQEEALANELAGKFYLARKKEAIARAYLHQAYHCYDCWGAKAKTQHLAQTYPQFFSIASVQKSPVMATILVRTTSNNTRTDTIDFASILKASQTLGSEIVLDKLLARMMHIILENAAAQRGVLILDREGTWQIEAEITLEPERVQVLQAQPLEELPPFNLPQSILTYAIRTGETLVLDNAAKDSYFEGDEYFAIARPQSLLCLPLFHQGNLIGLLYLEHHSIAGVFSPDRLEVLQMLTAQAAIALENALLYANLAIANQQLAQSNTSLEQKVRERTEQLQVKNLDLEKTLADLKQTQAQLIQAEKMSGIGQMVAGVAREINNPISFIYSNLTPARHYIENLLRLLELYRQSHSQPSTEIQETEAEIDLEFVAEDLPKLLDSMHVGSERITSIIKGLRVFSRLDDAEYQTIDNLHENIDSTLMLLQHHFRNTTERPAIEVLKEYGQLPPIACYASQLNQVFFNILTNAIDALRAGDRDASAPLTIRIRTEPLARNRVRIAIADNGCGMDEATRQQVFEPFFTTKPIGSGTGLGLSTSYKIIVEHHKGAIACQSYLGEGTEFIIEIPVQREIL
ncbi:MAG: AAA family ATPase [Spirulina sp.]